MTIFKFNVILVFIVFLISHIYCASGSNNDSLSTDCEEENDCVAQIDGCNNTIGFFYNETVHDCVMNIKLLLQSLTEKYDTQDKIRLEILSVFQGVIISVILFVSCATICVLGSCIYCCRINYIDYRLKSDVEALASKLKRDCNLKKPKVKMTTEPKSESCNIVVEDAGVYVV
ncbi:uncharacterized protein [Battus philenor]|uniref:uncharacterized protein n=1 Tax=Battus philenor TaxID=42288 RepID=UPI0035D0508F